MVLPSRSSLLLAALAVSSSSTSLAAPAPDSRTNDVVGNQLVASRSGPMDSFIIAPVGEHSDNVKEPRDAPENCKGPLREILGPVLKLLPLGKRAGPDDGDAAQDPSAQSVLSAPEQSVNGTDTTSVQPTSTMMMPRDEPTTNGTISSSASTPSMTDGTSASQAMLDPSSGTTAPPNTPVSSDTNTVPSATPSSSVSSNVGRRGLADLGNNTEIGTPTNSTILPTNTA